jgi:hypothetical protein
VSKVILAAGNPRTGWSKSEKEEKEEEEEEEEEDEEEENLKPHKWSQQQREVEWNRRMPLGLNHKGA